MSSSFYTIEVIFRDGKIVHLSVPNTTSITLEYLSALLKDIQSEPQIRDPRFSWRDEGDNDILLDSDSDLYEAIEAQTSGGSSDLRFYVTVENVSAFATDKSEISLSPSQFEETTSKGMASGDLPSEKDAASTKCE